jgi:lysophospholipase L1-like esterase
MLRARIVLAGLAAGLASASLACDSGSVGSAGEPDAGSGQGGVNGSGGARTSTGAGGALLGTGGATSTVDAGGTVNPTDAARDVGVPDTASGVDAARPGTGGATSTVDAGGRGTGGSTGGGSAGTTGTLPPITIWIAGDSTVATGSAPCPIGWGGLFKPFFNAQVAVTNSAIAGRSVRTWLYFPTLDMDATGECILQTDATGKVMIQARWQAMLDGMKAGDYLFIQFGINDSSATCDRHVGLDAFKTSYGVMAQAAKDRGAHPIFLTPTSSIACNSANMAIGTRGGYVTATQQAGTQFAVPVIDLHALTVARYNALKFCPVPGGDVSATTTGPVGDFFCDDHTHFSPSGAVDIATLVAGAVRAQIPGLAGYLK